eukprot:7223689-Prymnesium_polylepis.1
MRHAQQRAMLANANLGNAIAHLRNYRLIEEASVIDAELVSRDAGDRLDAANSRRCHHDGLAASSERAQIDDEAASCWH